MFTTVRLQKNSKFVLAAIASILSLTKKLHLHSATVIIKHNYTLMSQMCNHKIVINIMLFLLNSIRRGAKFGQIQGGGGLQRQPRLMQLPKSIFKKLHLLPYIRKAIKKSLFLC